MEIFSFIPAPFYNLGIYCLELGDLKKTQADSKVIEKKALKVCLTARDCFVSLATLGLACLHPVLGITFLGVAFKVSPIAALAASVTFYPSMGIVGISAALTQRSYAFACFSIGTFAAMYFLDVNRVYRAEFKKMWKDLNTPLTGVAIGKETDTSLNVSLQNWKRWTTFVVKLA